MSTTLAMSAEENRRQMRGRFDAVNEAAENKRWSWRDVDTDDTDDFGENDSLGG